MELSPEERQRIYAEEKARLEAQAVLKAEADSKKGPGCGTYILVLIVGCLALLVIVMIVMIVTFKDGTGSHQETVGSSAGRTGNEAHDRLSLLTVDEQASFLGKIINEGCIGSRAFYAGMGDDRSAFWSVGCTNGKSYQIQINPDARGSTKVLECSVLKAVANTNCFERFPGQ